MPTLLASIGRLLSLGLDVPHVLAGVLHVATNPAAKAAYNDLKAKVTDPAVRADVLELLRDVESEASPITPPA